MRETGKGVGCEDDPGATLSLSLLSRRNQVKSLRAMSGQGNFEEIKDCTVGSQKLPAIQQQLVVCPSLGLLWQEDFNSTVVI